MKKTQWIDFFQRIRRSKVSFIAILVFVTCGVALYTGIRWSGPSFYRSMENDYDALKLRDLELVFTSGVSEEGLNELRRLPEVSEIEGVYVSYPFFCHNGERFHAKLASVTNEMDLLRVNEGRLPREKNEIAVETRWAKERGLSIGDTIVLDHDGDDRAHLLWELTDGKVPDTSFHNEDGMQYLHCDTFTVTALVDTPAGLSTLTADLETSPVSPAALNLTLFVARSAFDSEAFPGYTGALVRSDSLRGMATMSAAYKKAAAGLADALRPTAERLCEEQAERIRDAMKRLKASPLGAQYSDMEVPSFSIALLTRENLGTVVMTGVIGDMMSKLCMNYGSVFIILGIFVCYSTLSRLVYQETVLSGTKKALGFYDREIVRSYMLYAAVVTLLGVIVGTVLSVWMVQTLLLGVLGKTYLFSALSTTFQWKDILALSLIEIMTMLLSAWIACHKTLRKSPLTLLVGAQPPSGEKRFLTRTSLYRKLPLLYQCILQNFLNDRRRVIGTLIGIIGCTVLTVSSVTFDLAVTKTMDRQFGELQRFDTIVYFDANNSEAAAQISSALDHMETNYAKVCMTRGALLDPAGKSVSVTLLADDKEFENKLSFQTTKGELLQTASGPLLSCAFANQYGIDPGGTVDFLAADGRKYELPVGGIMECYILLPRLIMTAEEYETLFGTPPLENVFLVEKGSRTVRQIAESLSGIPGYINTSDHYAEVLKIKSIIDGIVHACMILYLVLSVLIALFVILDILLMFVAEKKRELITLTINGYSRRYVRRYITADTVLQSVVGILVGVALGMMLGAYDINTMESDITYFLHGIQPIACLAGMAFTAILITLMTGFVLRKVDRFRLSEINEV